MGVAHGAPLDTIWQLFPMFVHPFSREAPGKAKVMKRSAGRATFLCLVLQAAALAGQDPAPSTALPVTLHGLVDVYYSHNATNYNNDRPGGGNALHTFDLTDNAFVLSLVMIDLSAGAGDAGAHVRLGFGPVADWMASLGNVGPPSPVPPPADASRNLLEAYLTYRKNAWDLDLGKFLTDFGLEVLDGREDWNYSRSFLTTYAIPHDHTGLRVRYLFGPGSQATFFICDGWNNGTILTHYDKNYGGQLSLRPLEGLSLRLNATYGDGVAPLSRRVGELIAVWKADAEFSFAMDYALAQNDSKLPNVPGDAWSSLVLYARFQPDPVWALSIRGEDYIDHDGFTTGSAADLREGTVTLEHSLAAQLTLKLEGRYDWAVDTLGLGQKMPVFNGSPDQTTVTLGALYGF